jgi:3',5'-nucleoside bisphosphate phosphatase
VHPPDDPWARLGVPADRFAEYVAEIEREAERAREQYGLLVVPGSELTVNHADPDLAAGAALVAAHPSGAATPAEPPGATRRFWRELEALGGLVDRFELINGHRVYGWVAEAQLPAVAAGDFHRIEHLAGWKTLLPCASDAQQVVACLRSGARLHLTPFSPRAAPVRLAA